MTREWGVVGSGYEERQQEAVTGPAPDEVLACRVNRYLLIGLVFKVVEGLRQL